MQVNQWCQLRATDLSLGFLGFAACYFLLAGDFSVHEVVAGFIACAGTSGFASLLRRAAGPRRRASLLPAECTGAVLSLVTDSVAVGQVLMRVVRRRPAGAVGSLHHQAIDESLEGDTRRDPAAAGRRAALTLAKSIAPNEFVVDIDQRVFIVHRLADTQ